MIENEKYFSAFFDRQKDYYLEKYRDHLGGAKFTFNIGAFLGGIFWFLYRKLFLHALFIFFLLMIFNIVEGLIFEALQINSEFQKLEFFLSTLLFAVAYGYSGNYFYLRQAERKVTAIVESTEDEDKRITLLEKKGGVSWLAIYITASLTGLIFLFYGF